jgi:hypothetical protein
MMHGILLRRPPATQTNKWSYYVRCRVYRIVVGDDSLTDDDSLLTSTKTHMNPLSPLARALKEL